MVFVVLQIGRTAAAQEFEERWNVEFSEGPIVAPAHVVGRGGTEIGVAEGSGSQTLNPAAVANRYSYNGGEWFDWDWSIDWLIVGLGDNTDITNDGRAGKSDNSAILNLSLNFLFGAFGIGFDVPITQHARSCRDVGGSSLCEFDAIQAMLGLNMGYGFLDGSLIVAGKFIIPTAVYTQGEIVGGERALTAESSMVGLGGQFGMLWRPHDLPFRLGATFRTPMRLNPEGRMGMSTIATPRAIVIPWQVGIGASISLGPREMNPKATYGDEELSPRDTYTVPMWRMHWLFALDIILVGPIKSAAGVAGWLSNEVQRSGRDPTVSVRLGTESEFWPGIMRGRLGTYFEPSRFEDTSGRFHVTGGFDLYLFELIWDWRFTFGIDWAPRYLNLMFSVGFWH